MNDLAAVIRRAPEAVEEHHAVVDREVPRRQDAIDGRSHVLMPTRVIGGDLVRILDELVGAAGASMAMYGVSERMGAITASFDRTTLRATTAEGIQTSSGS